MQRYLYPIFVFCLLFGLESLSKETELHSEAFSIKHCFDAVETKPALKNKWLRQIKVKSKSITQEERLEDDAFVFRPQSIKGVKDLTTIINGNEILYHPYIGDYPDFYVTKVDCKKSQITFSAISGESCDGPPRQDTFDLTTGAQIIKSGKK